MGLYRAGFLLLAALVASVSADIDWNTTVPIDEYVYRDDGFYSWEYISEIRYDVFNVTVHIVNMTSQQWFDENFCDRHIWWHYVGIAIPDQINYPDIGMMWIGEGSNRDGIPGALHIQTLALALFAGDHGIVAGYTMMIPNQPIVFVDDPEQRSRSEDSQIAWVWSQFLNLYPDQPELLSRFPMTKAAVKGMDTIEEVTMELTGNDISRFMITGASKRGWTTWITAAVDKRVEVAVPLVMGLLNMRDDMMHHYQSLGGWSFAFNPYYRENITMQWDNPNLDLMAYHVDPYSYRKRLTMPKIHIYATGDEFFLLSESHYWYDEMTQPMYLMMCWNAEHVLFPHYLRIYEEWSAAALTYLQGIPWPEITWEREFTESGGIITMRTNQTPLRVRAWFSTTLDMGRRDWRLFTNDGAQLALWNFTEEVQDLGDNTYSFEMEEVPGLWTGFFLEGLWEGVEGYNFHFTTEVHIIPDTFPFPPCEGLDCYGELV